MKPAALLIQGDARHLPLRDGSVQMVVTSPPYWGLRDYRLPPLEWSDGWHGSLGLELRLGLFVQHLVEIFREVRRVLRDDGTVWVNLGDGYASGDRSTYRSGASDNKGHLVQNDLPRPATPRGLKPKDLLGIPWRVAFALQADGWWLRRDIIWAKDNPMPESASDRPTSAHEYLFLLTKSERYFYDRIAVLEPCQSSPSDVRKMLEQKDRIGGKNKDLIDPLAKASAATNIGRKRGVGGVRMPSGWNVDHEWSNLIGRYRHKTADTPHAGDRRQATEPGEPNAFSVLPDGRLGRNLRSVWPISTQPFPGAHFATFPRALVVPCILASTSERGACARCGAPWERIINRERKGYLADGDRPAAEIRRVSPTSALRGNGRDAWTETTTAGWCPTCRCGVGETVPCVVLDPFCGSGTAVLVAKELGRVGIGVDLKPEYLAMADKRTAQGQLL